MIQHETGEHPIAHVAIELQQWAYTDSLIVLDLVKLTALLIEDERQAGYLPSDKQCELLICGGDDGAPPAQLVRDFPKTNAYLEKEWE